MADLLRELQSGKSQENAKAVNSGDVAKHLAALPGWKLDGQAITKQYSFKDFHETMRFVNAVADVANGENHHPDMTVGYNKCGVSFSTHSAGGLTMNDFISAAKVEGILSS